MKYEQIMKEHGIPDQFRAEFVQFIDYGAEANVSDDFDAFSHSSTACQKAIEEAFLVRLDQVQRVVGVLQGQD